MGHGTTGAGAGTGGVAVPSAPPLELLPQGTDSSARFYGWNVSAHEGETSLPSPSVCPLFKLLTNYSVSLAEVAKPLLSAGIIEEKSLDEWVDRYGEKPLVLLLRSEGMKNRAAKNCPLNEVEQQKLDSAAARLSEMVSDNRPGGVLSWWANALLGEDKDLDETSTMLSLVHKTVGAVMYEVVESSQKTELEAESQELENLSNLCHSAVEMNRLARSLRSMSPDNPKYALLKTDLSTYEGDGAEVMKIYKHDPAERDDFAEELKLQREQLLEQKELVQQELEKLEQMTQSELDALRADVETLEEQIEELSAKEKPSLDELGKLYKALGAVSKSLKPSRLKHTVKMLENQVKSRVQEELKQEFQRQFKASLSELERAGASRSFSFKIEIGAAFSIFGLDILGASGGINYQFKVAANDDSKIMDYRKIEPRVSLNFGSGEVAKADAAIIGEIGEGRTFPNLDEFAAFHSNDMLAVLLNNKKIAGIKGVHRSRKADSLKKTTTAEVRQLEKELQMLKVISPGDRLVGSLQRRPSYTEFNTKGATLSAGASAMESLLTGGASFSATVKTFTKRTDLVQTLRDNPGMAAEIGAPPQFGVTIDDQYWPGEMGDRQLRLLEFSKDEALSVLRGDSMEVAAQEAREDLLVTRAKAKSALKALEGQYKAYIHAVNCYDAAEPEYKAQLQTLKHNMELGRGAIGRGECLRSFMLTHVRLVEIYQGTFTDGKAPAIEDPAFANELEGMEAEYRLSQVTLNNEKHVRTSLMLPSKAKSTNLKAAGFVNVGAPYTPLKFRAALKVNRITSHPNPDNDGRYFNVCFGIGGVGKFSDVLTMMKGEVPFNPSAIEFDKDVPWFQFDDVEPGDFGFETTPGMQVEFNIIRQPGGGPRLQYIRVTTEKTHGGATPQIPIAAGPWGKANLKLGISSSAVNNKFEYIGNNTLTYLQTRYNGLALGGKTSGDDNLWARFIQANKSQFLKLLSNMANPKKNAHEEMQVLFDEMNKRDDIPKDFPDRFEKQLEAFTAGSLDEGEMLEGLNEFMQHQHVLHKAEMNKRFCLQQQYQENNIRQVWHSGNEVQMVQLVTSMAEKPDANKELKQVLKVINDPGYSQEVKDKLRSYNASGVDTMEAPMFLNKYQLAVRRS